MIRWMAVGLAATRRVDAKVERTKPQGREPVASAPISVKMLVSGPHREALPGGTAVERHRSLSRRASSPRTSRSSDFL
jgi:hypothetical protein